MISSKLNLLLFNKEEKKRVVKLKGILIYLNIKHSFFLGRFICFVYL